MNNLDDVIPGTNSAIPTRGVLGENLGAGTAREVLPGGNGRAIAGHGRLEFRSGDTVIPQGTILVAPRPGIRISDETGRVLESIDLDRFVQAKSDGPESTNTAAT